MYNLIVISIIIATIVLAFFLVFVLYNNVCHILKQETSSSKAHSIPLKDGTLGIMFDTLISAAKSLYPGETRKRNKPSESESNKRISSR